MQDEDAARPDDCGPAAMHGCSGGAALADAPDDRLPLQPGSLRGRSLRGTLRLVSIAWIFGSVWFTSISGAPLTVFAQALDASKFQFGLLTAIPFIASLASMPSSLLIERTGRRKSIFFWGLYLQRWIWIPMALLPMIMIRRYGEQAAGRAMILFIWLFFIMYCGNAAGGPAWTSWMADICPERLRGKYFSRRRQWGIASGIPAAILAGWALDHYCGGTFGTMIERMLTLKVCAVIFIVSALFGVADIAMFHAVPEIHKSPQDGGRLIRSLAEPLKNPGFLWFAGFVGMYTFALSFMGQFVTLYMLDCVRMSSMNVQMLVLVAPMVAQLIVLPMFGRIADRMGKKPLLVIASLGLVPVGIGWSLVGPQTVWLGYVLSALGAALWTGAEVANFNLCLEVSGTLNGNDADESAENGASKSGSHYAAVNAVIINIAGCLGGVAAGIIAECLKDWRWLTPLKTVTFYDVLFLLSGGLRLLAVVIFLPHIHEPTASSTRDALRYMSANIYNNVFNALLQPLRVLRVKRRESYRAE